MPLFSYKNPLTGEIFDEIRNFSDSDKPFILEDGTVCDKIPFFNSSPPGLVNVNAEVWQKDPDYIKKMRPKYLRTRSGHRVKYDPTKHNGSK